MSLQAERLYEFGHFRVDPLKRRLLRDGETVALTSKAFDTLLLLVERRGEVVTKDEMMQSLWRDTIVEENNLTQQVSMLRKVLGERAHEHRYIVTVPGRGYSFVAGVREVCDEATDADASPDFILEQHTRSLITFDVEEACGAKTARAGVPENKHIPSVATSAVRPQRIFLFALVTCGLLAAALAHMIYQRGERAAHAPTDAAAVKSIAVLPFHSLNASEDDGFGAGMSDTLIAKLSNVRQIAVRPASSALRYAGADALRAGRELGVDSVLEGTVQKSGERVRVTVKLFGVGDARPLWAQSFDTRLDDIFAVQDAISEQVARAMVAHIGGDEREHLLKHHTENVAAYEAYLRGRYFWNKRNGDALKRSAEYFQQAIDADPAYALAYAGLADANTLLVSYGLAQPSTEEGVRRARAAALKAIEIDETVAEAHASLGSLKLYYDLDNAAAESEFKRAIELNPSYATAHHWYSDCLAMEGRLAEAMSEIARAQELDPLSPIIGTTLGERLYYSRRYDESIAQLHKTLEVEPDFIPARFVLGLAYEQKGMFAEAIAELRRARELAGKANGSTPMISSALGHSYAAAGMTVEAREVLGELRRLGCPVPYEMATVYTGLGEKRQALAWLRKTEAKKARWLLEIDPRLDALRSDPKFQDLLRT